MGNRVMERPNLSGGTTPRHLVPKAVRRRRKRALRRAAGARPPAAATRPRAQQVAGQVVHRAKPVEPVKLLPPAKSPARPAPKPPHETSARAPRRRRLIEGLTPKRAPRPSPVGGKPQAPAAQTPPPVQEPEAGKGRSVDLDTLQDGAIEWGIKREA